MEGVGNPARADEIVNSVQFLTSRGKFMEKKCYLKIINIQLKLPVRP